MTHAAWLSQPDRPVCELGVFDCERRKNFSDSIGKTHFCQWLLAEIAKEGGTTLRGGAHREEGMAPYAPIAEALDRLLALDPGLEDTLSVAARETLALTLRTISATS